MESTDRNANQSYARRSAIERKIVPTECQRAFVVLSMDATPGQALAITAGSGAREGESKRTRQPT